MQCDYSIVCKQYIHIQQIGTVLTPSLFYRRMITYHVTCHDEYNVYSRGHFVRQISLKLYVTHRNLCFVRYLMLTRDILS